PAGDMKGYSVRPTDTTAKLPVVVVIHENRGLNRHIRDIARRMALEGFTVFAPDFLSSAGGTPSDEDKARDLIANLDPEKTIAEGVETIAYLKSVKYANGKVGVMGFCWGGGLVNDLAVNSPDLDAGVPPPAPKRQSNALKKRLPPPPTPSNRRRNRPRSAPTRQRTPPKRRQPNAPRRPSVPPRKKRRRRPSSRRP
ncbi:hypothetical protein BLX87_21995, partial [Bacillus sp. VT-16-64]